MNKYGNRDYALLGLYEAYIYVKQDRLNIMDRMLVDLKEECAKDSNYYDFFGEIVGYDNFVQYVFDRLLSLGCEDATKYEGLVSRYGDIKKQVGGKYINLNDYDFNKNPEIWEYRKIPELTTGLSADDLEMIESIESQLKEV